MPSNTIKGHVYDTDTSVSISSAFVRSGDGKPPAPTNAEGYYEIKGCSPSTGYTLTCCAFGYKSSSKIVTTDSDGKLEVNFYLQSEEPIPKQDTELEYEVAQIPNLGLRTDCAQSTWMKTFGGPDEEWAYSVDETIDGGYVIAGTMGSYEAYEAEAWIIKTDSLGNKIWDKTFGGAGNDRAESVQETIDGGYIITGTTYGAEGSIGKLIKTDSSGNEEWNRTFDRSSLDRVRSVYQNSDNSFIITGDTHSSSTGGSDVWLIKTNSEGYKEWEQTFHRYDHNFGWLVQQTSDGGFIIIGMTGYFVTSGIGSDDNYFDFWLIKTDPLGNKIWDKTFGRSEYDNGKSVQQTEDGGFIVTGETRSYGAGDCDVWLIKTDPLGNKIWDKTFGGSEDDEACSVKETIDGGYIIAGITESYGAGSYDIWLIKTGSKRN